jgi:hypothetical protein
MTGEAGAGEPDGERVTAIANEIVAILGGGGRKKNCKYTAINLCPYKKTVCSKIKRLSAKGEPSPNAKGPCRREKRHPKNCRGCPEFGSVFRWRGDGNPNLVGLPRYLGRRLKAFTDKKKWGLDWRFSDTENKLSERGFDISASANPVTSKSHKINFQRDLIVAIESENSSYNHAISDDLTKVLHSSASLMVFIYHWQNNRPCPKQMHDWITNSTTDRNNLKEKLLIYASFYLRENGTLIGNNGDFNQTADVKWGFYGIGAGTGRSSCGTCGVDTAACTGRSGESGHRPRPSRGRRAGARR